jgi:hypothetical protein
MPNPASTTDLEERWRPLTPQETTNANAFLGDAWALLVDRRPTLEADMTAGTVSTANVVRVVSAMVLRILKNPDGYVQESIDDWSGRRADLMSSGVLTVTPSELADITPGRATNRSIRLVAYGEQ